MTIKRKIEISVLLALLFSVLLYAVRFEANCADVKSNVLRLHILANSNLKQDQQLKIKVRDRILSVSDNIFNGAKSKTEAIKIVNKNKDKIINEAKKVIKENGYNYTVTAKTEKCYFTTREYDNFTLPAGIYDALNIKIGSGKGHNWWCVLFPEVCLSASSDIGEVLTKNTAKTVENPKEYKLAFKTAEWFEQIKNKYF